LTASVEHIELIGVGLYTPAEASRLVGVPSSKIVRWLGGHTANNKHYERLWRSEINLGDGQVYLGFRDLMEIRVANAFIQQKLSAQKVRQAIEIARDIIGEERPLSTTKFRTDGRTVFLQVLSENGDAKIIDLFRSQFAFKEVIEPSLKNIEFEDGVPVRWWPLGKAAKILVDPNFSFGRPIESETGIPADILASAAEAEGSIEAAARTWRVSIASINRAIEYQTRITTKKAA